MRRPGLWAACALWALSFIASKVALETAPPLSVAALRLVLSALCFIAWFALRGWPAFAWSPRLLWQLFALSLAGTSLHYGTQTAGLQFTSASNASLYAVTCPVCIALIAAFFLGERLSGRKVLGILLACAGVILSMGPGALLCAELRSHLAGDLLVFASIFLWALFTVCGKKLSEELGALAVTGAATILGAVTMLPVAWAELRWRGATLGAISWMSWLAIGFLGLTCSFAATLLYFRALERTESQKVGVYLYAIPPMTYAAAWLFLGEQVGWGLAAGSVMVLSGVFLTERG
ncbi:MAG: DMT family transporter [Elusimicrobia bacterium]|nr:DMT family transporter [Elusimicrobiota bacterium]